MDLNADSHDRTPSTSVNMLQTIYHDDLYPKPTHQVPAEKNHRANNDNEGQQPHGCLNGTAIPRELEIHGNAIYRNEARRVDGREPRRIGRAGPPCDRAGIVPGDPALQAWSAPPRLEIDAHDEARDGANAENCANQVILAQ